MASKFTITAELSLQTKNLNQVVRNLQSQFNNANLNIKIKDLAQAQSHIQKISSSSKQASKDVGVLGNSMEQAFKRFTVITAVTGTLIAFTRAIKRSISEAIDFEREVVKIAQATGQTVSQLRGLTSEIDSVATSFGVASKELILSARSLTQAGFAADKVAGSLEILAQTELAATFDSIQDTTEGAIALLNQFGKTAQKTGSEVKFLEQSFSAINQVSKEFAVESSDLVTAIRTTGAAFESAGGDLNELLALFTSVRSTTRESAESIATGFRTIFTRVQRVDTINALKSLGIELQDVEGKFIGPMEAVKRLSTALNTIDPRDFRFNLVVEELGGFRQVSKVIPLIQQFAVTQKALNVAQGSSGSLAKDAQTAQQALAVQIAKTREEFQKFMREMVASETFQSTVRTLLDLASAFIKVADSVKPLIPLIATFGAMKAGAALVPALRSFAGSGKRGGIPIGFATGGLVPGSGNGDTVPAMLSPGEFVIRKSSVNKIGAGKLARMNSGGIVQYFEGGSTGEGVRQKSRVRYTKPFVEKQAKFKELNILGSEINGLAGKTKVQGRNNQGVPIGIGVAEDKFKIKVAKKAVFIHPDDSEGISFAGGGGSGGEKFEDLLSEKLGYSRLNSSAKKYPFDLIMGQNILADAKDKASSSVGEEEGVAKAANYLLHESLPGYKYSDVARQKIQLDSPTATLAYDAGKLTPAKDSISPKFKVELLYPKPLSQNVRNKKFFGGFIQKFASGGLVDESKVGAAILESDLGYGGKKRTETLSIPQLDKKTWTLEKQGLSIKTFDSFRESIDSGLVAGLETAAKKASSLFAIDLGFKDENFKMSKKQQSDFLSTVNRGAYGNLFEQVLSVYRESNFKTQDPGRPFDFTSGLNNVLADDYDKLQGINYIDARSSFSAAKKEDFENKIKNTLFPLGKGGEDEEDYESGRYLEKSRNLASQRLESLKKKEAISQSVNTYDDFRSQIIETLGKNRFEFAKNPDGSSSISALNLASGSGATDLIKGILGSGLPSGFGKNNFNLTEANQKEVLAQIQKWKTQPPTTFLKKFFGGQIHKFASGGFASGSDTVPAMLTPGEFVVNKKSAQRVGYANLNRMNKVGKYANGGVVQGFARGGSVGKAGTPFDVSEQRSQLAAFLREFRRILDPGQARLLKDIFRSVINTGGDLKSALDQASKDIRIRQQSPQRLSAYLGTQEDIEAKRQKYIGIGRQGADDVRQRAQEFLLAEERKLEASNRLTTNLTIFGGVVTSVVSQMGLFDNKTAELVSTFSATIATIKGIGSNLTSMAKGFADAKLRSAIETGSKTEIEKAKARRESMNKAISGVDIAISGFAAAIAVSSTRSAQFGQEVEKAGKQVTSFIEALARGENVNQNKLIEALTSQFQAAENQRARSSTKRSAVAGGIGLAAGIGTALIPGGAAFSPVVSMGVSGIMDEVLWQLGLFGPNLEKASAQAESLGKSLYSSTVANNDFEKLFKNIDKTSNEKLVAESKKLADAYSLQLSELSKFTPKMLQEANEEVKTSFNTASEAARKMSENLSKTSGELMLRAVKSSGRAAEGGFILDPMQQMKDALNITSKQIRSKTEPELKAAEGNAALLADITAKMNMEIQKAQAELIKGYQESTEQQMSMMAAQKLEISIRNELIGSMQKQLAVSAASERITYNLESIGQSLNQIDALYSGNLSGMKSRFDASAISMTSPDRGVLSAALDPIRSLGPVGQELAARFMDINAVLPTLEAKLLEASEATDTMSGGILDTAKFVKESFGIDASNPVGKAIAKIITNTIKPESGSGTSAEKVSLRLPEVRARIFAEVKSLGDQAQQQIAAIVKNFEAAEAASRGIAQKLAESGMRQVELSLQTVDSLSKYADSISKARGKDLTLFEKTYLRNLKQQTLAGRGFRSVSEIGDRLLSIQEDLKKADFTKTGDARRAAGLVLEQNRLKKSLEGLANQSDRTSDVLAEIEKFRKQRESLRDIGKEFATGTSQEREELTQNIQAAMTVAATGTFQSIPEEMRKGANAVFERFADIPGFKEAQNRAIASELMAAGAPDAARMVLSETSTPEQKLISELKNITLQEIAAQAQLSQLEQKYQAELSQGLQYYSDQIGGYTKQLENVLNEFAIKEKRTLPRALPQGRIIGQIDPNNLTQINEVISRIANANNALAAQIDTYSKNIEKLNAKISAQTPQKKALGGLIYRAGGGDIFKPKGTDTVPAMLTPGEYVIKKSTVDKMGKSTLDAINAGYFSRGGLARRRRAAMMAQQMPVDQPTQQAPQLASNQGMVESYSGLSRIVTDVRGVDRKAARLRRESPEYAAAYAQSTRESNGSQENEARKQFAAGYNDIAYSPGMSDQEFQKQIDLNRRSQAFETAKREFKAFSYKNFARIPNRDTEKRNREEIAKNINAIKAENQKTADDKLYGRTTTGFWQGARNLVAGADPFQASTSMNEAVNEGYREGLEKGRTSAVYRGASTAASLTGVGAIATSGIDLAARYGSGNLDKIKESVKEKGVFGSSGELTDLVFSAIPLAHGSYSLGRSGIKGITGAANAIKPRAGQLAAFAKSKTSAVIDKGVSKSKDVYAKTIGAIKDQKAYRESAQRLSDNTVAAYKGVGKEAVTSGSHRNEYLKMIDLREKIKNRTITRQEYAEYNKFMKNSKRKMSSFKEERFNDKVRSGRISKSYYASGGSVPAMLTPGEYVMNSSAVSKYGSGFMNHLNSGGLVKYLRRGGSTGGAQQTSRSVQRTGITEYLANKQQSQQAVWDNKFQQQAQMNPFFTQMGGNQMYGMGGGGGSPQLGGMEEFGAFVNQFKEAAGGMTMSHSLTVDGQLNIAGIDGNAIAAQISQALGQYVGNLVQQHLNKQNRRPGT